MDFIKGLLDYSSTEKPDQQPATIHTDEFEAFYDVFGDDLLTKSEYKLIYDEMDKKDYSTEYPQFDRYMDLKRIKKEILEKKEKMNASELKEIILETYIDGYPPYNIYTYNFDIPILRDEIFRGFYEQYRDSSNRLSLRDYEVIYNAHKEFNEYGENNFHIQRMIDKIVKAKKDQYHRLKRIFLARIIETLPEIYEYDFIMRFPKKEPETFMVFLRNNEHDLKETGLSVGEIQVIWLVASGTGYKDEFNKIKERVIRLKQTNGNKTLKHILITGITESIPSSQSL